MTQKYAKIFNLQTKNDFTANFDEITHNSAFQTLNDKFTVKPFFVKYKALKNFLALFSYFIQLVTVAVSFVCVVALLEPLMPSPAAYTLSFVVLVLIEGLKRLTFSPAVAEWLQFRAFATFQICLCVIAMTASVYLTYKGGHDTVFTLTAKPTLISSDSLTSSDKSRITTLNSQLSDVKRLQTWKEKLTPKGAKNYEKILSQIETIENRVSNKESRASSSNDKTLSDHLNSTQSKALTFRYVTVLLDLLLLLILAWLEYYDFRSFTELATLPAQTPADAKGTVKTHTTGSNNAISQNAYKQDTTSESRATVKNLAVPNETNVQNISVPACEHCATPYDRKTTFQKYCSDQCRIAAWEKRHGRTLKIKKNFSK